MADASDQRAVRADGQVGQGRIALFARQAGQADLDQLVVVQRPDGLIDHSLADAGIADQDDGFEGVGEATQVSTLFFGKLHTANSNDSGASR